MARKSPVIAPVLLHLLLFICIIATLPTGQAFSWKPCTPDAPTSAPLGSSSGASAPAATTAAAPPPPLLTPTDVTLTPDPPEIGASVSFDITGPLSAAVTGGTIGLRVKFEGVDLYEEQGPLCEKIEGGCPRAAGGGGGAPAKISYRQDLPPIAPPGHYAVRVVGTTGESIYDGDAVVCVDVEFEMVMPSAAALVGAAGAAGAGAAVAAV